MAKALNAKVFQVPMAVWEKMTPVQQWAANVKFLDRQIAKGVTFRLATPLKDARPGSAYVKEIKYIIGKGYTLSKDGLRLIAGGK